MTTVSTEHIELTPEYFISRRGEASLLADQNERYAELQHDPAFDGTDVAEFRGLGNDALYQEQVDTVAKLLGSDNEPYTAIVDVVAAKASELQEAQIKLETISDAEDERKTRLLTAARRLAELAPYAENAASQLAHEKISALQHLDRRGLQDRIGQLGLELTQLQETLQISAQPWPVPLIIQAYNLAMDKGILIEDEIPLEPETQLPGETLRKLMERHGTTHQASLLLAAYLIEHPDTIFMPQTLGAYLYTDESHFNGMTEMERERCITQRIHRLLNQDARVNPMLDEQGYQLQYGYRHFLDSKTGKPVQRKRRIYRAVKMSDQPGAPGTFEEMVYPDLNPEVSRPMVVRGTHQNRPNGLAAEMDSPEETQHTRHITEIAGLLWELNLLPGQVDETVTVRSLRAKILQLGRAERKSPPVKKLLTKAAATIQTLRTDATDIVMSAVDKQYEPNHASDKGHKAAKAITASVLEQFYESLAD